jgi:Uma2 family endonuclease
MARSTTEAVAEIHYPDSDGQPMGETGIHVNATMEIFGTLKILHFRNRPDVYVTADMFFYYEQGNPKAVKAPDVMVIKGVESQEERRSYKLWVEKRVPCVVFEVTSEDTKRDDTVIKLELYARLGILEYFLFDPLAEYLDPPLQGYRLKAGRYEPIVADEHGRLESLELGLKLDFDNDSVRYFDPLTDQPMPTIFELGKMAEHRDEVEKILRGNLLKSRKRLERERKKAVREAAKAEAERQKADAERQKADAERQKADAERQKAEAERQKAEAERQKAEAERQKAEALEAEVARLRALLADRENPA